MFALVFVLMESSVLLHFGWVFKLSPFLPNLRTFASFDVDSVKLLLVLPCGHLSAAAAAHNTFQTLTCSFREPGLGDTRCRDPQMFRCGSSIIGHLLPQPRLYPILRCREENSSPVCPRCQRRRKAREKHISGRDMCFVRGRLLYFSVECFGKKSRTALLTEIHGRRDSHRMWL